MASGSFSVLCFIRGRPGDVEGICIDLDIAVHGESLDDVQRLLEEAIHTYIEDASREDDANRERLLKRRAPFFVRLGYMLSFLWHTVVHRKDDDDTYAASIRPCRA